MADQLLPLTSRGSGGLTCLPSVGVATILVGLPPHLQDSAEIADLRGSDHWEEGSRVSGNIRPLSSTLAPFISMGLAEIKRELDHLQRSH